MNNNLDNEMSDDILSYLYSDVEVEVDEKRRSSAGHKVLTTIGIIVSIVLIPILIINLTLLVGCFNSDEKVPGFMGYSPLIVLTNSMAPVIDAGDLIIIKEKDTQTIKKGDVISYFNPTVKNKTSIVTHRVVGIEEEDGEKKFRTRGDANNTDDLELISPKKVVGEYKSRIKGFGDVVMFMQTTQGFIICVGVPLIALIVYDTIRRNRYNKKHGDKMDDLLRELNELKRQRGSSN